MSHLRPTSAAALAIAIAAVAAPTAGARPDLPGLPIGASAVVAQVHQVDLRSPDAQDAAAAASPAQDLRSPDARDAAGRVVATRGPSGLHITGPRPSAGNGTDWGDVAIAGGAVAGLLLIGGGTILATHRRDAARKTSTLVVSG